LCNNQWLFDFYYITGANYAIAIAYLTFVALQMGGKPNFFPHELPNLKLVLSQPDA
jgi:hypothetical protein